MNKKTVKNAKKFGVAGILAGVAVGAAAVLSKKENREVIKDKATQIGGKVKVKVDETISIIEQAKEKKSKPEELSEDIEIFVEDAKDDVEEIVEDVEEEVENVVDVVVEEVADQFSPVEEEN